MTSTERFGAIPVADEGTSEEQWAGHTSFPPLDIRECPALVLVAPHPDDEILGVGGLAGMLAARGTPVTIVSVTHGEASHPGSPTLSPPALAERRRRESEQAADCLGLPAPLRCGLPDGAVAAHENDLAEQLRAHLRAGMWCAAPLRNDGHPDHEAAARAAARATHETGATLIEYPIWMWHWSFPTDPAVPWQRARLVPLPPDYHHAKKRAVEAFETQIAPLSADPADRAVLPPHILARLLRDHETVFVP